MGMDCKKLQDHPDREPVEISGENERESIELFTCAGVSVVLRIAPAFVLCCLRNGSWSTTHPSWSLYAPLQPIIIQRGTLHKKSHNQIINPICKR